MYDERFMQKITNAQKNAKPEMPSGTRCLCAFVATYHTYTIETLE